MLVLTRKTNEKIVFPDIHATVQIVGIQGGRVRLGIDAPETVTILREEIAHRDPAQIALAQQILSEQELEEEQSALTQSIREHEAAREVRHAVLNRLNAASLGLALARRQMQCQMITGAESTLAKVCEEFELLQSQVVSLTRVPEQVSAPKRPKALLVEDDTNECELLAGFLRIAGYEVATTPDGTDALGYLASEPQPDVVLLDMFMPRCDGPSTVRAIRRNPAFSHLKIFAVSGSGPERFEEGMNGIDRWFRKPVNPELLLREMNHELSSRVPAAKLAI